MKEKSEVKLIAAVRVRSLFGTDRKIKDTMNLLRLRRVNTCVVMPDIPELVGMLKKAKNYITWGEVNEDIIKSLIEKRAKYKDESKTVLKGIEKDPRLLLFLEPFRLSPPKGGYKSVKQKYPKGALGHRGGDIEKLLKKMM